MKPRSPKIITRAIVFLLLGTIINVAVAWGCALLANPYSQPSLGEFASDGSDDYPTFIVHRKEAAGSIVFTVHSSDHITSADTHDNIKSLASHLPDWVPIEYLRPGYRSFFDARGWPRPSMCCKLRFALIGGTVPFPEDCVMTSMTPVHYGSRPIPRVVPMKPIWPGFAINTVFYAAVLAAMFLGPGMVRRAVRRRRGLCPACGYPVGTSDKCTECGHPLPLKVEDSPRRGEGRVRVDAS